MFLLFNLISIILLAHEALVKILLIKFSESKLMYSIDWIVERISSFFLWFISLLWCQSVYSHWWYLVVLWGIGGFLLFNPKNCLLWNVQFPFWLIMKLLAIILTGRYVHSFSRALNWITRHNFIHRSFRVFNLIVWSLIVCFSNDCATNLLFWTWYSSSTVILLMKLIELSCKHIWLLRVYQRNYLSFSNILTLSFHSSGWKTRNDYWIYWSWL